MKKFLPALAVLLAATSVSYAAIVALKPAKPVAHWPGNGNARDTVGKNNGLIVGNVRFPSGVISRAFSFDGNHSFVAIPNSPTFDFQDQLTIEFWMRASPDNAMDSFQGLVASDFFGVEISNGYGGTMGVNFYTSSDAGASWNGISNANGGGAVVSAGVWHHIVGVYDGTKTQLYIDGIAWGSPTACSGNISPMLPGSFLSIGGEDGRTFCGCNDRYFKGLIDEVKIYNRALSGFEVKSEFSQGRLKNNHRDYDYRD